jgi:hypothetical protein
MPRSTSLPSLVGWLRGSAAIACSIGETSICEELGDGWMDRSELSPAGTEQVDGVVRAQFLHFNLAYVL